MKFDSINKDKKKGKFKSGAKIVEIWLCGCYKVWKKESLYDEKYCGTHWISERERLRSEMSGKKLSSALNNFSRDKSLVFGQMKERGSKHPYEKAMRSLYYEFYPEM